MSASAGWPNGAFRKGDAGARQERHVPGPGGCPTHRTASQGTVTSLPADNEPRMWCLCTTPRRPPLRHRTGRRAPWPSSAVRMKRSKTETRSAVAPVHPDLVIKQLAGFRAFSRTLVRPYRERGNDQVALRVGGPGDPREVLCGMSSTGWPRHPDPRRERRVPSGTGSGVRLTHPPWAPPQSPDGAQGAVEGRVENQYSQRCKCRAASSSQSMWSPSVPAGTS